MRVLLIANSKVVFGKELKNELNNSEMGMDVSLLDFASLTLTDAKNNEYLKYNKSFSPYKNIPKISMFFRMLTIRRLLNEIHFDVVNIHISRWFYIFILKSLTQQKLVITFYGSDFYRTSNFIKKIQTVMYKKADSITFTNPLTKQSFLEYYKDFEKKSYVCRFGLKTLDYIDKNREKSKEDIKILLGYNTKKIIVTCGYNATKAQQHKEVIVNIVRLEKSVKNKIQFIFPMTYGDMSYKEEIKQVLLKTDLDYIVLEDFLYEDDNAYIKLASDIMINVLETDSFSGSMQEFLYANNMVIVGSWLPYDLLENEEIKFTQIDKISILVDLIPNMLNNIKTYTDKLSLNRKIIYSLTSWKNNLGIWLNVYRK